MKKTLRKVNASGLEKTTNFTGLENLNSEEFFWLECETNNRNSLNDLINGFKLNELAKSQIYNPEQSTRVYFSNGTLILNLPVSSSEDIFNVEYLTIVHKSNILTTILPEKNQLFNELIREINRNHLNFELNLNRLVYYLIGEILQNGIDNLSIVRKRIKNLSLKVDRQSKKVDLNEVILCKRDLSTLSDLVEDQYNMLRFVPKIDWSDTQKTIRTELSELVTGFEHLHKSYLRLEDKSDVINLQFQLVLQERGNKKLNALTIVQSIFVPLTFISGIYGMNFSNMPELYHPNGYFIALSVMICISIVLLILFQRRGWFK